MPPQASNGRKPDGTPLGTFVFIDFPGSSSTQALGVNAGSTKGAKMYVAGTAGAGFVFTGANHKSFVAEEYRTILPAGANLVPLGVNDQQNLAGYFEDGGGTTHGFILISGKLTQLDVPFAAGLSTYATGINNAGEVVGIYVPTGNDTPVESFTYLNGTYQKVKGYPHAVSTYAESLNNPGDLVGFYIGADFGFHGFILKDGKYTSYDPPGSVETLASAINDDDVAVGAYCPDANCENDALYSFYEYNAGSFTTLTLPWVGTYSGGQMLTGINDQNEIVGYYTDQAELMHGFLAAPSRR